MAKGTIRDFSELAKAKTKAPEEEAKSHKPTFGEAAERPEEAEPEGDPTKPPQTVEERLAELVAEQKASQQNDPDRIQREGENTTESALAPPVTRPHVFDPMTGHIHYAGDVAPLPGGTIEHETDES